MESLRRIHLLATDEQGECLIFFAPGSGEDWLLLVQVIADGYVPRFARWSAARGDLAEHLPADGRFIRRQFGAAAIPLTQKVEVYVKPGMTTQVELGGSGRRVVGKARADVPGSRVYFQGELVGLAQSSAGPGPRQTEPVSSEVPVQGQGQRDLRQYVLVFDSDGAFRVDDVLPGPYELEISAWDQRQEDSPFALAGLCPCGPFASPSLLCWVILFIHAATSTPLADRVLLMAYPSAEAQKALAHSVRFSSF